MNNTILDNDINLDKLSEFNNNSNDNFIPITYEGIKNIQFVILNRWGGIMYETDSQDIKWDGKFNGKDASRHRYVEILAT